MRGIFATFLALLAIINPLGNVGILLSITDGDSDRKRLSQVCRGHHLRGNSAGDLLPRGGQIMHFFYITIDAVRVAGGLILLKIGFDLLSMRDETRSTRQEQLADRTRADVAFFPLAMPLIAGPGALTLVLTKAVEVPHSAIPLIGVNLAAIAVAVAASCAVLCSTQWLLREMGVSGLAAISRIMGFLLVCISVQMVIWGIQGVMKQGALGARPFQ
ncbi:MAG: MarC family protein [Phycisphaerales bacterium]|nr:MarC family protein [Phycisphaerales bacterium]